jgi:hypothetical protein
MVEYMGLAYDQIMEAIQPLLDPEKAGPPAALKPDEAMEQLGATIDTAIKEEVRDFYSTSNFQKAFQRYYQSLMLNLGLQQQTGERETNG